MKNILFIGATHGDESLGVEALRELEKTTTGFDWIIGNPKAFELKTREFEGDLNRSAPGDATANQYTKRRAAEILELSKEYRYTIDLHGTNAYTGIFVIVTNPTKQNLELAIRLGLLNIVIWPSFSQELTGPLSEFFPCGLEIECGPKNMPIVKEKLVILLQRVVEQLSSAEETPLTTGDLNGREFYEVYGSLTEPTLRDHLVEFTQTTLNGETFSPLLISEYQSRNNITCYKMKKIDPPSQLFL